MYDPVRDGVIKNDGSVSYKEAKPPQALSHVVHSYWQIKAEFPLADDFTLHAIPDACINILFNQIDTEIAGITALKTTYTELNLGKSFDYAGIQLFPGVWQENEKETSDGFIGSKYLGELPLIGTNIKAAQLKFYDKQAVFTELVLNLLDRGTIKPNAVIQTILSNLENVHSVSEMATVAHLSTRQLQRVIKESTGFSPHDFLKVIRLQESLRKHNLDRYTDQSHYIRSFKNITGYTPTEYFQKYDV